MIEHGELVKPADGHQMSCSICCFGCFESVYGHMVIGSACVPKLSSACGSRREQTFLRREQHMNNTLYLKDNYNIEHLSHR